MACSPCQHGKTVPVGKGTCDRDCKWEACEPANFLDTSVGCTPCSEATYSAGGDVEACTPCPISKSVDAGKGTCEKDCEWAPCEAAFYLDKTAGCMPCPEGSYNGAGMAEECKPCSTGKTVAEGKGETENDCRWLACLPAHFLDRVKGCQPCAEGSWSAGGGVESCQPCEFGKSVEAGKGSCEHDCVFLPCEPGNYLSKTGGCTLCPEGSYSAGGLVDACKPCPKGKNVAAGKGSCEGDCLWLDCEPGSYMDSSTGCTACPEGSFSPGGSVSSCSPCPVGRTVASGEGTCEASCVWLACTPGNYLEAASGCTPCPEGSFSAGAEATSCSPCTTGKTVGAGQGKCETDCKWMPCEAAFYLDKTAGCQSCPADSYSPGGLIDSCSPCSKGKTVAAGQGKCVADCKWNECPPGNYVDKVGGCTACPAGSYSPGGLIDSCSPCPSGTSVPSGAGKCRTDCTCPDGKPAPSSAATKAPKKGADSVKGKMRTGGGIQHARKN